MHIPDGFLNSGVSIATGVVAAGAIGIGMVKARDELDEKSVPLLALCTAFVFAAQMLNFPVAGGTSGHFLGAVLAVVLLGPWLGSLVIGLVLLVQCLGFADGGISALGANAFNMAVVGGIFGYYIFYLLKRLLPRDKKFFLLSAGGAAWLSVVLASGACAVELAISGTTPLSVTLPTMLGIHAVIGVGEAVITTLVLAIVLAARPDLIRSYDYGPRMYELDEAEVG
ncbi:MAG: cobalamin biosynthesis protein CbiM [Candidatus Solincola sediminis]|uniref:Cobalamin biosynthesis protein CbiM n=1 Tax=Candidatus Solincola sediminis TaxID=1797199 RepID=A0A1F2WHM3_9ACTN|nr:MAG: cobalamin biosynthesis protein CbiM [Candidatus Solincola sediminis]OFW61706.1 MAG: cobalamin biosynthesis protein CbiM [Candidatus Solincola sediminis]